ncbi:metallophosphoesterase [Candidatus Dojkabacteria bacterium]|nr:metallophosphoesterase [Candidatus Dojkabacteria bacterium]
MQIERIINFSLDAIIAIILLFSTGILYTCAWALQKTRTNRLFLFSVLGLTLSVIGFFFYGIAIEPFSLITTTETIDLDDFEGEESLKLILVSDLHAGRFFNTNKIPKLVKNINDINETDYLLILGDVINQNKNQVDDLEELKKIDKEVYFVYGNHDYFIPSGAEPKENEKADIVPGLEKMIQNIGANDLKNESIKLEEYDNFDVYLAGIEDVWSHRDEYEFLETLPEDDVVILMCHNPDCVINIAADKEVKKRVDLVVSGHTHGGEMRLPLIGSIAPQGLPIFLPQSYDKGYHTYEDIPLYITSGVGNVGVRMRTFNTPEIVLLTIK